MSRSSATTYNRDAWTEPPPPGPAACVLNTRAEHDRFIDRLLRSRPAGDGRSKPPVTIIGRLPIVSSRPALCSGWCPQSRWREHVRHFTMVGIRTMQRCAGHPAHAQDRRDRAAAILSARALTTFRSCRRRTRLSRRPKPSSGTGCSHTTSRSTSLKLRFTGDSRSDWFLAFLERFPTPASITIYFKEQFVDEAWDIEQENLESIWAILTRPLGHLSACPWQWTAPRSPCSA